MYSLLDAKVDVYTMDHRGVGRSDRLECKAAQASTSGSPGSSWIRLEELPACMADIAFQLRKYTQCNSKRNEERSSHVSIILSR